MAMTQTICPYSLLPLTSGESNEEHILPRSLGAPASFTVRALAAENSRLNDLVDEPTVNDPFVRFLAMSQGVVSRSGPVKAAVCGTVVGSGEDVAAVFGRSSLDLKFRQPVDTDILGRMIGVRGFGDVARQMAAQITANFAKKGMTARFGPEESRENPQLNLRLDANTAMIRRQMFKVAYLTTVRLFGDEAITSQSGEQFRAAMMAHTDEELAASKIAGSAFQPLPPGLAHPVTYAEHAIICALLPGVGLATSVNLFGCFTLLAVTPTVGISASELSGEAILIEVATSKMVSRSYVEALPSLVAAVFQD